MSKSVGLLIARVFIGLLFLVSGIYKVVMFNSVSDALNTHWILGVFGSWFVWTLLILAIYIEILGSIVLIGGTNVRGGAALLLLFTGVATILYHADINDYTSFIALLKNLAIMGGLFALLVSDE